MARLTSIRVSILLLTLAALVGTPARAVAAARSPIDAWSHHIAEASARFGIPEDWIRRVMRAESGGRTHLRGRPIVSHAGAMGLMQLMPGTWALMRAQHRLGPNPHAPRDNILAGTAYLRAMYDRFGYPGLFGAYNAGPQRYSEFLARRRRLPGETVAYMAAVAGSSGPAIAEGPVPLADRPSIFAISGSVRPEPSETRLPSPAHRLDSLALFVPLRTGPSAPQAAPGTPDRERPAGE